MEAGIDQLSENDYYHASGVSAGSKRHIGFDRVNALHTYEHLGVDEPDIWFNI